VFRCARQEIARVEFQGARQKIARVEFQCARQTIAQQSNLEYEAVTRNTKLTRQGTCQETESLVLRWVAIKFVNGLYR